MSARDRGWVEPATEALQLAVNGDYKAAAKAVERMADEHGPRSVILAMKAWIDTALRRAGVERYGDSVRLGFVAAETGKVDMDADDVRPTVAWAGRLFAARIADDEATFRALLNSVPRIPRIMGDHIMAVLTSAALTVNGHSHIGGSGSDGGS